MCCVCGGDEPCADIDNPDFIVQLPDDPDLQANLPAGVTEAPCSLIKTAAETLLAIPAEVSATGFL